MQPPDRFAELRLLLATPEPPDLGPGPRSGLKPLPSLNQLIDHALHSGALSSVRGNLVRGLLLLWHDHHDASHAIVQTIENADGSCVHGILHRREPDYGNARYWFHRVGNHPAFAALADRALTLPAANAERALLTQLVPGDQWDASAFIDACEAAATLPPSGARVQFLRSVQAAEFHVLLEYFCEAGDASRAAKAGKEPRK
jgi:hypothetical protein